MAEKVLFVDDEPPVLEGYQRLLRREFEVETAVGGEQGLTSIQGRGPYALVVSDMRMPGMDGVQFLSRVKQLAPDTVRMVLTGQADMTAAMNAVNEGNIFRFLTKPCDKETLSKAITTGFVQYRLVMAEKVLLENTLMGSIKVPRSIIALCLDHVIKADEFGDVHLHEGRRAERTHEPAVARGAVRLSGILDNSESFFSSNSHDLAHGHQTTMKMRDNDGSSFRSDSFA